MVPNRHLSIQQRQSNFLDFKQLSLLQFQQKFQKVSGYVELKRVKNDVYLGERPLDSASRSEIAMYSQRISDSSLRALGRLVGRRWTVEYHEEGPVVQLFSGVILEWDPARNSPQIILRNGLGKMQEEVRKIVITQRFEKIKHHLNFFQDYRRRKEEAGKKLRLQDYLEQLGRIQKRSSKDCPGMELEFEFDKGSLRHEELPVDYQRGPTEVNFRQRTAEFHIVQHIGFDNWVLVREPREGHAECYQMEHQHPLKLHHVHMPGLVRGNRRGAHFQLLLKEAEEEVEIPDEWPQEEWRLYPGDCFGKEERFYWPEKEDKVSITDDEVCLGEDP